MKLLICCKAVLLHGVISCPKLALQKTGWAASITECRCESHVSDSLAYLLNRKSDLHEGQARCIWGNTDISINFCILREISPVCIYFVNFFLWFIVTFANGYSILWNEVSLKCLAAEFLRVILIHPVGGWVQCWIAAVESFVVYFGVSEIASSCFLFLFFSL